VDKVGNYQFKDKNFIFNNMRKDKIFELKIEEEDELSGIDSISLVDEPAIEVNWIAFNKEKAHDFVIPDGQDQSFSSRIIERGHSEEDLFNDGWKILKQEFVSSSPNDPSFEDTDEYLIRYKYILNPEAPGAPIKSTTREFCKDLLNKNLVYRVEDLEAITNDLGSSALVWRGSYNCRHVWQQITYHKGTDIVNKSSVTKGRVDGAESLDVLGLPQPDTRVPEWPSFSKMSQFDYLNPLPSYVDEISGDTVSKSLVQPTTFDTYSDYPESVMNNAKAVLKWVEENGWGDCGTDVGKQRANQLAKGEPISEDTIRRMYSYLSRHEGDLDSSKGYGDGCGKLMYDSWGGKTALSWAESKINSIEREKMSKQHFQVDSEEKRIILGPAMIPNQKIFRKDRSGNPYYVYFSPETIRMIAEKYMRNKYTDNNDQQHDGKAVKDVYVIESWIKEDEHDKSSKYGYESTPIGTWFVSMKVKNDEIWNKVKEGQLNGFSVSGYFEEVAEFTREEMFLYKLAEVLKEIKE